MGRLTRNPDVKNPDDEQKIVAKYTLAVPRSWTNNGHEETDFISCVAFGKAAVFASRFLKQGMKIVVTGRIQTGSYSKENQKIYTTDVIVEEQEFAESKASSIGSEKLVKVPGDNIDSLPISDELPSAD